MFISVKEAADLTGKSSTTIYRLCNKRINTLYVRKLDNKFLISKDFLLATYPPELNTAIDAERSDIDESERSNQISEPNKNNQLNNKGLEEQVNDNSSEKIVATAVETKQIIKDSTSVAEESKTESFYQNIASWEVVIGISASLLVIALFVYLISVFVK